MKFAPNIRINYLGDEAASRGLIGVGKSMVPILLNMSSFQNLKNNSFTRNFGDDTVITASHCFDQVTVDIWTRPVDDVVVMPKDDAPISPYSMIALKISDYSTWGFDGIDWVQVAAFDGVNYLYNYVSTSDRVLSLGFSIGPITYAGIWQLVGGVWTNIIVSDPAMYSPRWPLENTVNGEIWIYNTGGYVGSYGLWAYNPDTDTWRVAATYGDFAKVSLTYSERFGQCWDGERMWSMWSSFSSGEIPYWTTFNDSEGAVKGADLPVNAANRYICPFRKFGVGPAPNKLIWADTEVWLPGDPNFIPQVGDPTYGMSYADYPVMANDGINTFKMVDSGPGFAWLPAFWLDGAMWVRNESDNSVWSFDGTDWVKLNDGPGFAWADGTYTEGITI